MAKKIIIFGAGLAGLAAGYQLTRAGHDVEIFEKENQVGGLARTIEKDGYFFDLGGHRFFTIDKKIADWVTGLLDEEMLVCHRQSAIFLEGKFFNYPLDFKNLIFQLNPWFSLGCFFDFLKVNLSWRKRKFPELSFKDWVIRRFGQKLYRFFFAPYNEKLWGVSCDLISSDWAAQRISLLNLWDTFLRLCGKKKNLPRTYVDLFYYPKKGIGQISQKISEKITRSGGQIHLNSQIKKIVLKAGRVKKIFWEKNGALKEEEADFFIATIPLPELMAGIEDEAGSRVFKNTGPLKFRGVRFLNIMLKRNGFSENHWIYFPEKKFSFFRLQELANWSSHLSPAGGSSLILEYSADPDDYLWQISDRELLEISQKELKEIGFDIGFKVEGCFSLKEKYAYPVYTINYRDFLRNLYQELFQINNLILAGRSGLFRYNNMDHSIKMGFLAAEAVEGAGKEKILQVR